MVEIMREKILSRQSALFVEVPTIVQKVRVKVRVGVRVMVRARVELKEKKKG